MRKIFLCLLISGCGQTNAPVNSNHLGEQDAASTVVAAKSTQQPVSVCSGTLSQVDPGHLLECTYNAGSKGFWGVVPAPPQAAYNEGDIPSGDETGSRFSFELDLQDEVMQAQIANYDGITVSPFAHVAVSEANGKVTWHDFPMELHEWDADGTPATVKQYMAYPDSDWNGSEAVAKKHGIAFGIDQGNARYWLQDGQHNTPLNTGN